MVCDSKTGTIHGVDLYRNSHNYHWDATCIWNKGYKKMAEGGVLSMAKPQIIMNLRPSLLRFVWLMESKLTQNDHKKSWNLCEDNYLFSRLLQECSELDQALKAESPEDIISESVDVANFAMMIADKWANKRFTKISVKIKQKEEDESKESLL